MTNQSENGVVIGSAVFGPHGNWNRETKGMRSLPETWRTERYRKRARYQPYRTYPRSVLKMNLALRHCLIH